MGYNIEKNKNGKYQVIKDGASRATRVFDNYNDAKDYLEEIEGKNKKKKTGKKTVTAGKVVIAMILGLIIGFAIGYFTPLNTKKDPIGVVSDGELTIHFLELGNKYTGDSVYIKAGENDILIDAGSRNPSSKTITEYINNYVNDGTLEYVIATHAHQDHIAGFVGTEQEPGIFERFKCEIIIDFPLTNATSNVYKNYVELRDNEIRNDGATHYTALECYKEENGGKRKYDLGEGITLEILYNYYYENKTSDENDYSVCVLINDGLNNYLFTGDLEEKGEEYLVEYNDLPKCKVYKAGHHGSKTSSSEALLKEIEPEIVCVCCCAGSTEYTTVNDNTFPTQDFINRVSEYTDQIFVTTIVSDSNEGFESMNGNIIVSLKDGVVSVNCTNNNVILKDTEWFEKNRKWPKR